MTPYSPAVLKNHYSDTRTRPLGSSSPTFKTLVPVCYLQPKLKGICLLTAQLALCAGVMKKKTSTTVAASPIALLCLFSISFSALVENPSFISKAPFSPRTLRVPSSKAPSDLKAKSPTLPGATATKNDKENFPETKARFRCRCLGYYVREPRKCCNCEKSKCKCWHSWWRSAEYAGHFCRSRCSTSCGEFQQTAGLFFDKIPVSLLNFMHQQNIGHSVILRYLDTEPGSFYNHSCSFAFSQYYEEN